MDAYERLLRHMENPFVGGFKIPPTVRSTERKRKARPITVEFKAADTQYRCPACASGSMFPEHGHFRCMVCHHIDHCCEGHGTQPGA